DSATSDAEGGFRFKQLPLATYEVWAFDPRTGRFGRRTGYVVNGNAVVAAQDVVLEVRGEVEGHVLEPRNGAGIAGATVQLSTQSLVRFTTYSSSDVNGYFEFLGIPEGVFALSTQEPGGRRRARASGEIAEEGERVTVDLTLEAMGRVVGRVLSPAGAPDGLFPNANTLISQDGQIVGATLDNPYAFDGLIAAHGFHLSATEVGGSHRAQASGQIADPTQDLTVDLRMVPIGSGQVVVRDSFGTLLPGAEVTLSSSGFYGWRQFAGSTGAQGAIRFDGIGAGSLSAAARDPRTGLRGSASGRIDLEAQVAQLEVRLQDSGSIRGRVVLPDGVTPAADALVVVNIAGKSLRASTGGDGAFELAAVPMGAFEAFAQEQLGAGSRRVVGSLTANGQVVDLGLLVLDDRDPYVVSFQPETGSRDLTVGTVVTIHFSEPLDRTRFNGSWIAFRKLAGGGVGWNATWADGDSTLVLTPTSPLASFTGYEVIAGTSVVDVAGRAMGDPVRTVFYTRDVVPPAVVDVLPRDGQSAVPLDANLLVTFSEPVDFASLSGTAFQLTDLTSGGGVSTTFQQKPGRREVLLTPVGGLHSDRQYRLVVQGVHDDGGNVMAGATTTTFWTVDTVPPEIVSVTPAEGASFTAGDEVVFTIQATDARRLGKATVVVDGWEFTAPAPPYEIRALAPSVAAAGEITFVVSVFDAAGNRAQVERRLHISPRANATAPEVRLLCLQDGDFVEPGHPVELAVRVSDDEKVERVTVRVDGQVLRAVSPVGTAAVDVRATWTPPAGTPPGTSFVIEVEATDFANNVARRTLTASVPTAPILTSTRVIDVSYAGGTLYLARGRFLLRQPMSFAAVNLLAGATLVGDQVPLKLSVSGALRVQCGAALDVSGYGYAGGTATSVNGKAPVGVRGSAPDAGGSHGGVGVVKDGAGPAGEVYDSVYEPTLGGGGGARNEDFGNAGLAGGGVIRVEAGSLVLSGELRARGEDAHDSLVANRSSAGGGGGTVVVHAGTISGSGSIDAGGGNGLWCGTRVGAGGGGRVALYG
ncbi:MAG TPA: Ig-like domain-containing protein, partial [Thermoanaerobaculia bacterium]|nr:Ig-like domain-containing protein [Thermoanaerobaculia bacterium]